LLSQWLASPHERRLQEEHPFLFSNIRDYFPYAPLNKFDYQCERLIFVLEAKVAKVRLSQRSGEELLTLFVDVA